MNDEKKTLDDILISKLGYYIDLLENITDTVMITDLDGTILMWNKGAEEVFGYKKEEVIGTKVDRLYRKEDLGKLKLIKDKLLEGSRIKNLEITEIKRGDSKPATILLSIVPLRDNEGRVFRLAGIGKDISNIKKMEQKQIEAKKLEVVHDFVVALNHEMNQSLTVVSSIIQIMIDGMKQGVKPRMNNLELIHKQVKKMSELLKKINEVKKVVTTDYIKGIKMVDLEKSIHEDE